MTDAIEQLKRDSENTTIAALRYLAFLTAERDALIGELYPDEDFSRGGPGTFTDPQVLALVEAGAPSSRAETILRAAGIDPHRHERWVDFVGHVAPFFQEGGK